MIILKICVLIIKKKGGIIIIQEKIIKEIEYLDKEIKILESQIKKKPKGKLLVAKNGNNYKWYSSIGSERIYIPKKKEDYACELAEKKYLLALLDDMIHEKSALEMYLRHHHPFPGKAQQMLNENQEFRRLCLKNYNTKDKIVNEWLNEPYKTNPYKRENLIHSGPEGQLYRSKSEEAIARCLYDNNIPFRYECELVLSTGVIYPDFTIMHPKTLKIYYYEHFGMMDNPEYVHNACEKIEKYCFDGFYPTDSLIMSFETKNNPFCYEDAYKTIKNIFL